MSQTGKEQLGRVAYEAGQAAAPGLWCLDWEQLSMDDRKMFMAVAVAVRGFHPDA
jgi:hypothetical protein